jgi:hypothetical protein
VNKSEVDFVLVSNDDVELARSPRGCIVQRRVPRRGTSDAVLVRIEPPLRGAAYGIENEEVTQVVLTPKWENGSVVAIESWPVPVYVIYPVSDIASLNLADKSTYRILAWAFLEPKASE